MRGIAQHNRKVVRVVTAVRAGLLTFPSLRITPTNGVETMKTLKTLIAERGMNEVREIVLLNRRARYAQNRDRTKIYASTPLGSITVFGRNPDGSYVNVHDLNADLQQLRVAGSLGMTRDYVAAWCRLNHLKEC